MCRLRSSPALELGVLRAHLRAGPNPVGLAFDRSFLISGLDAEQLPSSGATVTPSIVRLPNRRSGLGGRPQPNRTVVNSGAAAAVSKVTRFDVVGGHRQAAVERRLYCRDHGGRDVVDGHVAPELPRQGRHPASVMPQGTMLSNPSSSALQLRRKPCIVTPRCTPHPDRGHLPLGQPVASTSAAGSHTPDRPSTRPHRQAQSVHTAMSASSTRGRTDDVDRLGEFDDRIADQLTRTVPRDLAAAVDVVTGVPSAGRSSGGCAYPRVYTADARAAAACRHPRPSARAVAITRWRSTPPCSRCARAARRPSAGNGAGRARGRREDTAHDRRLTPDRMRIRERPRSCGAGSRNGVRQHFRDRPLSGQDGLPRELADQRGHPRSPARSTGSAGAARDPSPT